MKKQALRQLIVVGVAVLLVGAMMVSHSENNGPVKSYVLQWQSSTGSYPELTNPFQNSETDTVLYLTGTTSDTSVAINASNARYLRINIAAEDTAAGEDSVNTTYKMYGAATDQFNRRTPPAFSRFAYLGEFTLTAGVTRDTTWAVFNDFPYGPNEYLMIIATGNTGNSLATPSKHVFRIIYEDGGQ